MPLYEYQCTACGKLTEKRQKFSDPEITDCPHCGGRLERTITAPAVQFKGGGWYADGYGSKKPAAAPSSEGGSSGSGDSAKSDGGSSRPESSGSKSETASTPATSSTPSTSTPSSTPSK